MIKDKESKIRGLIQSRSVAYSQTFLKDSVHVKTVLKDLAKFCRAHESTFNADARLHAVLEGRREVWLRIEEHLNLSIDEIYDLHKVKDDFNGEKK